MARRIAYEGEPVLTLQEVAYQCKIEPEDMEPELIEQIIIPGVTSQCESKTGAAIRRALYEEHWPQGHGSGQPLDVGQVLEVESVIALAADGSDSQQPVVVELRCSAREGFLHFPGGRPAAALRIRYRAGVDLDVHPGARSWMLMAAATAYKQRETLVTGQTLVQLPSSWLDHLLADITVPARF